MAAFVIFGVVVVFVLIKALSGGGSAPTYANIVRRGVPARGILLSVSATPSGTVGVAPLRYQKRDCLMDIEIPGQAPYEAMVTPLIPTNLVRDILPGATVELRIDKRRPNLIAVVGPGVGFNAALLNSGGTQ